MSIAVLLDRPVAFNRAFKSITKDTCAALLLSQLVYWHNRVEESSDGSRWFFKTQAELENETGLTRFEQESARSKLRELGILAEKRRGIPAKLFFKLDCDTIALLCEDLSQTSMRQPRIQECGNPAYRSAATQQSIKGTETTTETTTDINFTNVQLEMDDSSRRETKKTSMKKLDRPKHDLLSVLIADGVAEQVAVDFISHRKSVKAPLTMTALNAIRNEAVKAGVTLEAALSECMARGWRGFKADWMKNSTPANGGQFKTAPINQLPTDYGQSGRL
jgi:hypothetical protein